MNTTAFRCLARLKTCHKPILRTSVALPAFVPCKSFSLILKKRGILGQRRISLNFITAIRGKKYDKSSSREDEDSADEFGDLDEFDKKTIVRINVQSLRADLMLKTGVGIARNKIEAAFYENKIRINGKKITKKSVSCAVGDEIDLIKGESTVNPNHLIVARVEILSTTPKGDGISVTMKRFKNLTIERYQ